MRVDQLTATFVSDIPDTLAPGRLYVALEYDAMAHLCACGCGCEVSTPIGPTDWKIGWDGVNITVRPSIGSGSLACRSHYVIDSGRVRWYPPMTDYDVAEERARTAAAKGLELPPLRRAPESPVILPEPTPASESWFNRLTRKLFGRRSF